MTDDQRPLEDEVPDSVRVRQEFGGPFNAEEMITALLVNVTALNAAFDRIAREIDELRGPSA